MSEIAIEFDHVWKKFRKGELHDSLRDLIPALVRRVFSANRAEDLRPQEFWAVRDVSFEVRRGEALGIIGPNGAGKSTILKLLSRILRPNQGAIRVHGRLSALIEIGAGFHPDLTGRENIFLNGAILGMTRKEINSKFDQIVEFSGLEEFIDTPVKRYSSGMYARLGFAVAAHVDPEVLLVDEVLSVGDMRFQEKCIAKMRSFASSGRTIIFISHRLEAVNTLCTRTGLMMGGGLRSIGATAEVIQDYVRSQQTIDPGSGSHEIWDVSLVRENGKPAHLLSPGERVAVRFKLRSPVAIRDCLLGFLIHRTADGLPVCDYNLALTSLAPTGDKNSHVGGQVVFDANLLRGTYGITLHLYHCPTSKHLFWARNATFFSVEERVSWAGVSHLNPTVICPGGNEGTGE